MLSLVLMLPVPLGAAPSPQNLTELRAAVLNGTHQPAELIAELKMVLADHPESAEAHLLLGLAYRFAGPEWLGSAVAEYRQALALDPRLVAGRYYLARAYLDLGRPQRAREELETALTAMGTRPAPYLVMLSEAERQAGSVARALELAQEVPVTDPAAPQARYQAALALDGLGRRPEAVAVLEGLVKAGVTPDVVTATLGRFYLDDGRPADAIPMLEAAVEGAPARPDLRVHLARALRQTGQLEAARNHLAQALPPDAPRDASEFYETVQADIRLETGIILLAEDRLAEADRALGAALEMRPNHGATHRYVAELRLRQMQREAAAGHAASARAAGEVLPAALAALLDGK